MVGALRLSTLLPILETPRGANQLSSNLQNSWEDDHYLWSLVQLFYIKNTNPNVLFKVPF